ncbi:S-layer homology domain-containing protein [Paenibacillus sp. NRS-1760]|uniref:S-layer homology domain-containing protein n=1 Tax=Paenibacillus sp. NRS-1760 TaxID=3233902 RepID=UPI003D2AF86B
MKRYSMFILTIAVLLGAFSSQAYGMTSKHWAEQTIQAWVEAGYVGAASEGVKNPNRHLSREDMANLIEASVGWNAIDVSQLTNAELVSWAKQGVGVQPEGVVISDQPNKQVSREEAILLTAALLAEEPTGTQELDRKFTDLAGMTVEGRQALEKVYGAGIFVGNGSKLRPQGKMTFAELITALERVMSNRSGLPALDFENGSIPGFVTSGDSTIEVVHNEVTDSKALKVVYGAADFPTVKFTAATAWNFGMNKALAFEVTNPTDKDITFYLRIDDDKSADGVAHSTVSAAVAKANSTQKYFLSMGSEALDLGMRFLPPNSAGSQLGYGWGEKSLDTSHIVEFQMWQMYNKTESTLLFDNIRVIGDPNTDLSYMNDLVDGYGQYTGMDWKDKVHADQDLIADKQEEAVKLAAGQPVSTSKYGGWLDGPKLEATGHFRVTKHEGKWTLVDPDGYLFFSNGLDIVRLDDMNTWISGRENMFTELPSKDGELGDHYTYTTIVGTAPLGQTEGWLFNHYQANLERKYGQDYVNAWKDISVDRFKSWGFSSLGNWSDPALFFGKGEENQMAYVANGWSHWGEHATIPSGGGWAPVADPYDPAFMNSVDEMIDEQILAYGVKDDKWMIGVYIDNEIAWGNPSNTQSKYALITNIMAMDSASADSYAKRAMLDYLKEEYKNSIKDLNDKWGTALASFETLGKPFQPEQITEGMLPDYSAMLRLLADEYFRIVDSKLEKALPNALYLGSRFAEWGTSIEVQEAAAQYVDVISFNVYKEDVEGEGWMHLEKLDLPTIIGEFAFASDDRGMFGTGPNADTSAASQQNRAEKYVHYMETVLENPYFVGAHWFQYVDQPLLGRAWDGENYNLGFVDVADVPYEAMVKGAKEVHAHAYDIKFLGRGGSGSAGDDASTWKLSFEASENLSLVSAYKDAMLQYGAAGATDGERAMKVAVGKLDSDYSGVELKPALVWNLGGTPAITADVTNPNALPIQIRVNVMDAKGTLRTFYYAVEPKESKTISIQSFQASDPSWGDKEGFWGAEAAGLDASKIASVSFYLWEEAPESGDSFIIDNLQISEKK